MRRKESKILYPGLEREVRRREYILDKDRKVAFLKSSVTICSEGNHPSDYWTSVKQVLLTVFLLKVSEPANLINLQA